MAVQNSLAKKQSKLTFSTFISGDAMRGRINQMVGSKDGPRFITAIISAVSVNPALAECDYSSIVSAALLGESLKLSPSPQLGQYYMVPFKDNKNKRTVATFILGYKGYIQLAIRSGYYKKINVLAIKEGELVRYDPLTEEIQVNLIEDEVEREAKPTIGYYAMFEYQNGFVKALYWSRAKMEAHADKYSKAFSMSAYRKLQEGKIPKDELWKYSSYWYSDFDGMAYKTMLRQLISKWGIMSIEMESAFRSDGGLVQDDGSVEFVSGEVIESTDAVVTDDDTAGEAEPVDDASISPPDTQDAQDTFFAGAETQNP
jgi:recombination protein RecT